MKLLRLELENLNSLTGRWEIDFTSPEYADGLFLIAGDTGAGKTTILDAISLALYGRTVREQVSAASNEVMSRGAGCAFARVEFSTPAGRYAASWEQRRAREKSGGSLQAVRMMVMDCETGQYFPCARKSDAQEKIESLIGLTFERFQRTVMLAQGKFDQFLSAGDGERAEILQQATGTEIYERIGRAIFERRRAAETDVMTLKTRIGEIAPLPPEMLAEKTAERAAAAERSASLAAELDATLAALAKLEKRESERIAAAAELERREKQFAARAADEARARQALGAAKIRRDKLAAAARGDDEKSRALKSEVDRTAQECAAAERSFRDKEPAMTAAIENARRALDASLAFASLDDWRKRLEDGKPCPLCGSIPHPYAGHNNVPEVTECEKALDDANRMRRTAVRERDAARERRDSALAASDAHEKSCAAARSEFKAAEDAAVQAELAASVAAAAAAAAAKEREDAAKAYGRLNADAGEPRTDASALRNSIAKMKREKSSLDARTGALDAEIRHDAESRSKLAAYQNALAEADAEALAWKNLDRWLGGSKGEQFKRYAQGITLRRLLAFANPHLASMTGMRYSLVWNDDARLLPSIVDAEQGNETRPVSNLSGGERFQVSLALALGLSEMSSDRLNVDSLFLDEGFGTLDDASLEAALDTLCAVQQSGKLIGVISHVAGVADRIPTQILVAKTGSGRSAISGPGVTKK